MKILSLITVLMALAACASKYDSTAAVTPPPTAKQPDTTVYKVLTAEELFHAKFERIEAVCNVFAVDKAGVEKTDSPIAVMNMQVYPTVGDESRETITVSGPDGKFTGTIVLEAPIISTVDFSVNNKVMSQNPSVGMRGNINVNVGDDLSESTDVGTSLSTDWADSISLGALTAQDQRVKPAITATVSIACRLEKKMISDSQTADSQTSDPQTQSQDQNP